jgi:hypothetical protein
MKLSLFIFLIQLVFFSSNLFALSEDDECKYFKYCGSSSGTSSAKKSTPSASSSSRTNPSTIAKIKGLGLETLYQVNNPIEYSIVSGNGRFGTMVSSTSGENSFFGNRTPELEDDYLRRVSGKKRYKNNKYQIGTGLSLVDKKYFEIILGGSTIYNKDVKKFNLGYSATLRLFIFNFSAYVYKDDYKFDFTNHYCYTCGGNYTTYYGVNNYTETFDVKAFTIGTKLWNLSLDYALLETKYQFYATPTNIMIVSSALNFNQFLFNFAIRKELSENTVVLNNQVATNQIKEDIYYGVQYLPNKHLSLGIGYNNYLLDEYSFTMTLFL